MLRSYHRNVVLLLALCLGAAGCSEAPREGAPYFKGKRIEIIIPTSVGGGTDLFARLIGEGLARFVPGEPVVVPRQMAGGGGILAGNWMVEQAPRDGTVLLAATGQGTLRQILGQKAIRASADDFVDLIALPTVRTVTIDTGKGVTDRDDVLSLQNREPLHTALVDPIGGISFVLQASLMKIPLHVIPGYHGGRDRDLAMLRGEIDIIQQVTTMFASSTQPLLDRGAVLLWTDGLIGPKGAVVRDPGMPDVPTFPEVYESAFGVPPSGPIWQAYRAVLPLIGNAAKVIQVHKDAPPEAIEALREGVRRMVMDPEFLRRLRVESAGHDPLYGDELRETLREARSMPPALVSQLREFISERFEVEFVE